MNKKEKVNFYKKLAEKAVTMNNPCIRITPVFGNNIMEWAKIYYIFSEMTKKVQNTLNQPFLIGITEYDPNENIKPDFSKVDVSKF